MQTGKFDTKINLCDTCANCSDYPYCTDFPNGNDIIVFGDGVGNDNIYSCTKYKNSEKPMNDKIVYFSSELMNPKYKAAAERLFSALDNKNIRYAFIENSKDIWVRDFMPVKTKSGKYISFKYSPCYLKGIPELKTNYKKDISQKFDFPTIYSSINLDGGNIVFSPSREKVIISNRIFLENKACNRDSLVSELENLLEAEVIIIPSLPYKSLGDSRLQNDFLKLFSEFDKAENKAEHIDKMCALFRKLNPTEDKDTVIHKLLAFIATHNPDDIVLPNGNAHPLNEDIESTDMTGHADGMIRFIDENTVLGNDTDSKLEQDIKATLSSYNINVIDFPYYETGEKNENNVSSAEGCYLNYLETDKCIFLPVFDNAWDNDAIEKAKTIFTNKIIVPININEIAKDGGVLNCISWEN